MKTRYKQNIVNKGLCIPLFALGLMSAGAVNAEALKADFNGDGYEDLLVGIHTEDVGGIHNAGAVSVFYGNSNGLRPEPSHHLHQDTPATYNQAAIADQAESDDWFGAALAVGDFDNDGYDDAAIGVPYEGAGQSNTRKYIGAVNILYGSAFGLRGPRNSLLTLDLFGYRQSETRYGSSLATGDINGDGYEDLAVGIPDFDYSSAPNAGAVMVFFGGTGGLTASYPLQADLVTQRQDRVPGRAEKDNHFGDTLTLKDFDRDGYADLAVGIPADDLGTSDNTGTVVLLYGAADGLGYHRSHFFRDTNVAAGDRFGESLTAGDFNGDGYPDLAVGHPYEDASAENAGAVTVIFSSTQGLDGRKRQYWGADVYNLPGKAEEDDYFGRSLAAADFNGDGIDDLAIGTPLEDLNRRWRFDLSNTGQVTVLYGGARGLRVTKRSDWHQDKPGVATGRGKLEKFGYALSVGDFNQDRIADLVVGVPGQTMTLDNGSKQGDAGMVHIFYGTDEGLSTDPALGREVFSEPVRSVGAIAGRAEAGDQFGHTLP